MKSELLSILTILMLVVMGLAGCSKPGDSVDSNSFEESRQTDEYQSDSAEPTIDSIMAQWAEIIGDPDVAFEDVNIVWEVVDGQAEVTGQGYVLDDGDTMELARIFTEAQYLLTNLGFSPDESNGSMFEDGITLIKSRYNDIVCQMIKEESDSQVNLVRMGCGRLTLN